MALTKINSSVIANNTIAVGNIADNSVDATKIASNSILTRHIDDAQITTDQILDGTIATADIADDAVTEDKLANAINTSIAAKLPLAGGTITGTIESSTADINLSIGMAEFDSSNYSTFNLRGTTGGQMLLGRNSGANDWDYFTFTTNGLTRMGTASGDDLAIHTNSSGSSNERIRILSGGNVGIGTTSPGSALHVDKSFSGTLVTFHQTAGASSDDRGLDVETSSTGTTVQRWFNSGTELMRVTGTGNVGIGTTSPGGRLDVKSSGGTTEKAFHVQDSSGNDIFTVQGGGRATLRYYPFIIGNSSGVSLASGTRFFIDGSAVDTYVESTGRWAIGETTNVANAYLTVSSNNGEGLTVGRPGNNAYRNYRHVTSSGIHQWISTANTASLSNAGSWTNASDRAYKKDIVDIDYGLDTVKALQPRRYTVKADDTSDIGFIAQELEKHIPELVHGEDGEKGIDYGSMTSVLVKALQEQQVIIDDLKSRIETLEG